MYYKDHSVIFLCMLIQGTMHADVWAYTVKFPGTIELLFNKYMQIKRKLAVKNSLKLFVGQPN